MAIDLGSAIDAWREAVADAQAAERLLDQTWLDHLDRRGPAATEGLLKEVARFRSRAEARLLFALALMKSADEEPAAADMAFTYTRADASHSEPAGRSLHAPLLTAET